MMICHGFEESEFGIEWMRIVAFIEEDGLPIEVIQINRG